MADGEAAKLICEAGCLRIRKFTCATFDAMSGCSCILYADFSAFQHQPNATALNKLSLSLLPVKK